MELTQEYFDQKFMEFEERLEQNIDEKLDKKFDEKLANFATKDDLKNTIDKQTVELKTYADEQTDHLARIIETSIAQPLERVSRKLSTPFGRQM